MRHDVTTIPNTAASAHQKRERRGLKAAAGRAVVVTVTKRSGPDMSENEDGLREQVAPVGMAPHVTVIVPLNVAGEGGLVALSTSRL